MRSVYGGGSPIGSSVRRLLDFEVMDLGRDLPLIILLLVLFAIAGFVAAAEASLLRISGVRVVTLAEQGHRRGRRLAALLDDVPAVLNAILLTALLAQIGGATVAGVLAGRWFGGLGVTLTSIALTILLFVYAEAIPKTFAVRHPERVALALAIPVGLLERLLRPVVRVLVWFADLQAPGRGITTSPTVTEDELRRLAMRAAHEGEITTEDFELIERAFRVGDRQVDDIMVPRLDVVAITTDTTLEDAVETAVTSGHRRLPVHSGRLDDVVGVVRLRDLIVPARETPDRPVDGFAEPPLVVPESKRVLDLLGEMQESSTHLAVVVDEYGAIAGLVTIEDIAEELLGSITDEDSHPIIEPIGEHRWSVDARLPVEDLEGLVGEPLPEGEWNTAAGLVMGVLGRMPRTGDAVDLGEHRLTVTALRRRRIVRVAVERTARPASADAE